jgi:hypothetical protein
VRIRKITGVGRDISPIEYAHATAYEYLSAELRSRGFTVQHEDLSWRHPEHKAVMSCEAVEQIAEEHGRSACEAILHLLDRGATQIAIRVRPRTDFGVDIEIKPVPPLEQLAEAAE